MSAKSFFILLMVNLMLGLLQVNVFPEFAGRSFYINFVFGIGFAFLLLDRTQDAYLSTLMGGVIIDLFGVGIIGLSSFFMLTMLVFTFYVNRFFFRGRTFKMFLIFISNILYNFIVLQPHFSFNSSSFVVGALNLFVVFIIYLVLQMFQLKSDRYKL